MFEKIKEALAGNKVEETIVPLDAPVDWEPADYAPVVETEAEGHEVISNG